MRYHTCEDWLLEYWEGGVWERRLGICEAAGNSVAGPAGGMRLGGAAAGTGGWGGIRDGL